MIGPSRRRAARRIGVAAAVAALAGCQPNPRSEIGDVARPALAELARTSADRHLCVDRTIAPWQPAAEARRIDPPPPPGFERLYAPGVFRGGGGLKEARVGDVTVGGSPDCLDLRGPLIAGDLAMIEVHLPGTGWNVWMRRVAGDWRVVMTTTSRYPP